MFISGLVQFQFNVFLIVCVLKLYKKNKNKKRVNKFSKARRFVVLQLLFIYININNAIQCLYHLLIEIQIGYLKLL